MSLTFELKVDTDKFKQSVAEAGVKFNAAFATALNMVASLIKTRGDADIRQAGKFGALADRLDVTQDANSIKVSLDDERAMLFETGGTVHGKPLLWIPISGTDAEGIRASDYGAKLFSVNRLAGGPPLLFSVSDHAPKYFGTPSVNISKKFHIGEIVEDVVSDFTKIFQDAVGAQKLNG